jgi:hypothetical protein
MMRANIWTGICGAIVTVASIGVFAQPPQTGTPQTATPQTGTPQTGTSQTATPQTTTPAPSQSAQSSSDSKKITVTGCLKAAPQAGGTDTASATPTGTAGSSSATSTGTSGATDPATAKFVLTGASASPSDGTASAQTYRLIANPTALTEHVGKKLELVGTIDPSSNADPKDPSAAAPALRVESGKIIAASCSDQ